MRASLYYKAMIFLLVMIACIAAIGCGSGRVESISNQSSPLLAVLQLTPSTAVIQQGSSVHFGFSAGDGTIADSHCTWSSGNVELLVSEGSGTYTGENLGSTTVSATCYGQTASAVVSVTSPANPTAIRITTGGTYTGNWSSADPSIAAVTVLTDQPVLIEDSTVSGKGDLISIYGSSQVGANVTVKDVTGVAQDPGEAGLRRGIFVGGEHVSTLNVTQCTMQGISFGIYLVSSAINALTISRNLAYNMEDRVSDGNGGLEQDNRINGHFILLNGVIAPNGAEISWNQVIDTVNKASVEDFLNFYNSHGAEGRVIYVHDNYLQGAFGAGETYAFTGGGIQMDGDSNDPAQATGFIGVNNNAIVQTAGYGISVGAGHDISVRSNRIVSCGKDADGNWLAGQSGSALGMWNYYNSNQYYNNLISDNSGGIIVQDPNGQPIDSDYYIPSVSVALHDVVSDNLMDHPCWVNGTLSQAAEANERTSWDQRVKDSATVLGDQHQLKD
jgi:hypothetical protein